MEIRRSYVSAREDINWRTETQRGKPTEIAADVLQGHFLHNKISLPSLNDIKTSLDHDR